MIYSSTRGEAPDLGFCDVVLTGLASDGGLYLPRTWPTITHDELARWRDLSYADLTAAVLSKFVGDEISEADLTRMARAAYSSFEHPAVAPLVQLEDRLWLMELFHGPTLAFKDFALQLLGQLFEHVLSARGEHRVIVGATSGDTGSAAIEAVRGLEHVSLFMLHPKGRVSEVQRRQMTTVHDANIHNLAVDGDFDDCQSLVKAMFNDAPFRAEMGLSAVNSINWARIAAQIVYYVRAALVLGAPEKAVAFAVPSGNFGNVFAGWVAHRMGVPIAQLIVGSNRNDILARFLASGDMVAETVVPSLSPSMDIQVSSNFERLLFEATEGNAAAVRAAMQAFAANGAYSVDTSTMQRISALFQGTHLSDAETLVEMQRLYDTCEYVIDPHSAIGTAAARACRRDTDTPVVALATAHSAKFPLALAQAIGTEAPLPARVAHIMDAEERMEPVAADLASVQAHIRATLHR
ncbi:MAG: threonine synthase [Pseudomonadota bacterium]